MSMYFCHGQELKGFRQIPPVKFSPLIRDMIKQGKKLAQVQKTLSSSFSCSSSRAVQAEMYNDVLLLHKRVEVSERGQSNRKHRIFHRLFYFPLFYCLTSSKAGKMQEEESWKKSILDKQEVRRKQLELKISRETKNVEEKITGIRSTFEKSYVKAKE
eukprot:766523-Hanusia_phi.AAC.1